MHCDATVSMEMTAIVVGAGEPPNPIASELVLIDVDLEPVTFTCCPTALHELQERTCEKLGGETRTSINRKTDAHSRPVCDRAAAVDTLRECSLYCKSIPRSTWRF